MQQHTSFRAQNLEQKVRIDHFLVNQYQTSRTKVQTWIQQKIVFVNDQLVTKSGHLIQNDDLIKINFADLVIDLNPSWSLCDQPLNIVYEDQDLLVINKPSGLLSHPTIHQETNTLANMVGYYFQQIGINPNLMRNGIAHRLDKDTSGLMLVAKNPQALQKLLSAFANKQVTKKYWALINNHLPAKKLVINLPIGRNNHGSLKMVIGGEKDNKVAITKVQEIEQFHDISLVECQILTGRTHQIRLHLSHINCSVLNDHLYGTQLIDDQFGQYLHAYYLGFFHPTTNQWLEFICQWPEPFAQKYQQLKAYEQAD